MQYLLIETICGKKHRAIIEKVDNNIELSEQVRLAVEHNNMSFDHEYEISACYCDKDGNTGEYPEWIKLK